MTTPAKTVLFHPVNSAGHIHSSLAVADRLKSDFGARTVFAVVGQTTKSIEEHGHELIVLAEQQPYEDYVILDDDDLSKPLDEELMRSQGRAKKQYHGINKWPHFLRRYQSILDADSPIEVSVHLFQTFLKLIRNETILTDDLINSTVESVKPDLIVLDGFMPPACIVKREKECPWVRLHSANPLSMLDTVQEDEIGPPPNCGFSILTKSERMRMRAEEPDKWRAILEEWRMARGLMEKTMTSLPIQPLMSLFEKHGCLERFKPFNMMSLHLNVYMFPEALDYDREDDLVKYPERCLRCDSLMRKSIGDTVTNEETFWASELETRLKDKEGGMIYLSLGSVACGMFDRLQCLIDYLRNDSRHLYVISLGPFADRLKLNPQNMVGAKYLPQLFLLERAKLAIVHGGNNTITECMYYGVPMIVMPFFADQFDNAQRVEDLGFGKRLNPFRCSREEICAAIDAIESKPDLAARMKSISERMQSTDDTGMIASLLIKLAQDKSLSETDLINRGAPV